MKLMFYYHKIVQQDLSEIVESNIAWEEFNHKSVLVTGINGMLTTYIMFTLLYLVQEKGYDINIIGLTRSLDKTKKIYGNLLEDTHVSIIVGDVQEQIHPDDPIDFIFHFAGNASPFFINHDPVDILKSNLLGTFNIMELAKEKQAKVLFASTREVYGEVDAESLNESSFGKLDPMDNRSCYPESKRASETIIHSYFLQYGVKSVIARIAHSYGPGMKIENDGRVMADFIGNGVRKENIILKSTGEAIRSFLYLSDAVRGLFLLMLKGKDGEAYNLSNEKEPLPIYQIAQKICSIAGNGIKVVFTKDKPNEEGYCKYPRVALDNTKIEELGFTPNVTLSKGLFRTLNSFY